MSDGVEESILAALEEAKRGLLLIANGGYGDASVKARATLTAMGVVRPRPDYDPRIDYPERYTDGPI